MAGTQSSPGPVIAAANRCSTAPAAVGRDLGQVDVPGAGLAAVDLLQGQDVGVQGGDGRREPVDVHLGCTTGCGR